MSQDESMLEFHTSVSPDYEQPLLCNITVKAVDYDWTITKREADKLGLELQEGYPVFGQMDVVRYVLNDKFMFEENTEGRAAGNFMYDMDRDGDTYAIGVEMLKYLHEFVYYIDGSGIETSESRILLIINHLRVPLAARGQKIAHKLMHHLQRLHVKQPCYAVLIASGLDNKESDTKQAEDAKLAQYYRSDPNLGFQIYDGDNSESPFLFSVWNAENIGHDMYSSDKILSYKKPRTRAKRQAAAS